MGWAIDWGREISTARSGLLPLDAVALPALLREGPRLPQGGAGQVVPERPDRARERAGHRRPLRALRRRGRGEDPDAVVLPDHRLRRRAARRDGRLLEDWPDRVLTMQRNWIGRSHGARVVFSVDGSGEELPVFTTRPGHAVRGDVLRAGAREPAGRAARRRLGARDRGARLRPPHRGPLRGRARDEGEGRRLHRAVRGQSRSTASRSRSGSPTTC